MARTQGLIQTVNAANSLKSLPQTQQVVAVGSPTKGTTPRRSNLSQVLSQANYHTIVEAEFPLKIHKLRCTLKKSRQGLRHTCTPLRSNNVASSPWMGRQQGLTRQLAVVALRVVVSLKTIITHRVRNRRSTRWQVRQTTSPRLGLWPRWQLLWVRLVPSSPSIRMANSPRPQLMAFSCFQRVNRKGEQRDSNASKHWHRWVSLSRNILCSRLKTTRRLWYSLRWTYSHGLTNKPPLATRSNRIQNRSLEQPFLTRPLYVIQRIQNKIPPSQPSSERVFGCLPRWRTKP